MTKLPLWAWDEDKGKHVLFPFHLLTTVDGVQGLAFPSWEDTYTKASVFKKFRTKFAWNPSAWSSDYGYFFALRDQGDQVPDLDQSQREVGTDPILGDDHI